MIAELLAKLSPENIISLHSSLDYIRTHYTNIGHKNTFRLVKELKEDIPKTKEGKAYYQGYKDALDHLHDLIRDQLIFGNKK